MIKIELECEVPTDATHYRLNIFPDGEMVIEWWAKCKSGWAIWNGVYWELRLPLEAEDTTFFKEITLCEKGRQMKMPTEKQIEAGHSVASEMIDAQCRKSMHGLGGCIPFNIEDFVHRDLIAMYLNDEIDSVTGIYLAMQRAGEEST